MHQGKPKFTNKNRNHKVLSSKEDNSQTNTMQNRERMQKDEETTMKCTYHSKPSKSRARTHRGVISTYSKLHYRHDLKYDSLFLATDIFETYL